MFDGKSKQRNVSSGSGKRKDISRDQVLQNSKTQREIRAKERLRREAAILIQCRYRRFLEAHRTKTSRLVQLQSQLEAIRRIVAIIPNFNVPFDTVLGLMKLSVFGISPSCQESSLLSEVSRIVSSFAKQSSFQTHLISENYDVRISCQFLVSSFCSLLFKSSEHLVAECGSGDISALLESISTIMASLCTIISESDSSLAKRSTIGVYLLMRNSAMSCARKLLLGFENPAHQHCYAAMEKLATILLRAHSMICSQIKDVLDTECSWKFLGMLRTEEKVEIRPDEAEVVLWGVFASHILTIPSLWNLSKAPSLIGLSFDFSDSMVDMWTSSFKAMTYFRSRSIFVKDGDDEVSCKSSVEASSFIPMLVNFFEHSKVCDSPSNSSSNVHLIKSVPTELWIVHLVAVTVGNMAFISFLASISSGDDGLTMEGGDEEGDDGGGYRPNRPATSLEDYIRSAQRSASDYLAAAALCKSSPQMDISQLRLLAELLVQRDVLTAFMDFQAKHDSCSNKALIPQTDVMSVYSLFLLWMSPVKRFAGDLDAATLLSRMIATFSFGSRSLPFIKSMWSVVDKLCTGHTDIARFMTFPSYSKNDGDIQCDPAVSHIFVLVCTLVHQLQSVDDVEFMNETRTLDPSEFGRLICILKAILYYGYWVHPALDREEDRYKTPLQRLYSSQLLWACTMLYNQLAARNERLNFLSQEDWLWAAMSSADFEVISESGDESQTDFSFRNSRITYILEAIPQVISFKRRVEIFQQLLDIDKQKIRGGGGGFFSAIRVEIRRDNILHSAFEALHNYRSELKKDVKVIFISEQGTQEAGIDGGGLFKEFLDSLMKEMGQFKYGFFRPTPKQLLVPSAAVGTSSPEYLEYYTFLGRMLGKAIYEKILVEPQFAGMFLNQLLGRLNLIDDLDSLDEEIYVSLLGIKRDYLYGDKDISDLQLFFEVSRENPSVPGGVISVPLIPNGSHIPVTKENLVTYLYLYANFKLNVETSRQSQAFLSGFRDIVPLQWIRMFTSRELQMLIGGDNERPMDVDALKVNCTYSGGYHPSQPYMQEFWRILASFDAQTQAKFLQFVTSCSRQPLLGFEQLNPPFNIMKVALYTDEREAGESTSPSSRLPMASSCFNQLKLPQYDSTEELRHKLLYAIQSKSGFELS